MNLRHPIGALLAAILLGFSVRTHGADAPALTLENGGLKNTYRVVFEEFDETNHFARGALEILGDDDGREAAHTRIPFAADIKADTKDKKSELLQVRCTVLYSFFPPADKKEPYPPLTWKLTGRKTKSPVLHAKLWEFDADKGAWVLSDMEFEKPQ